MSITQITIDQKYREIEQNVKFVLQENIILHDEEGMTDKGQELFDEFMQKAWDTALEKVQENLTQKWDSDWTITQDAGFFASNEANVEEAFGEDFEEVKEELEEAFVAELEEASSKLSPRLHADIALELLDWQSINAELVGTESIFVPKQEKEEGSHELPEGPVSVEDLAAFLYNWDDYTECEKGFTFSFYASL